jgi:hypothetical protein
MMELSNAGVWSNSADSHVRGSPLAGRAIDCILLGESMAQISGYASEHCDFADRALGRF